MKFEMTFHVFRTVFSEISFIPANSIETEFFQPINPSFCFFTIGQKPVFRCM